MEQFNIGDRVVTTEYARKKNISNRCAYGTVTGFNHYGGIKVKRDSYITVSDYHRDFWTKIYKEKESIIKMEEITYTATENFIKQATGQFRYFVKKDGLRHLQQEFRFHNNSREMFKWEDIDMVYEIEEKKGE